MRLPGLELTDQKPVATDLAMLNLQQICQAQPGGVGHQQPCLHERAVRALHTPSQLRGYRQKPANLGVGPRNWAGRKAFDAAQGPEYTRVHHSFSGSEGEQTAEHAAVVVYRGGCEMGQSFGQVVVTEIGSQVPSLPRQTANEDLKLLKVAGTSADAVAVGSGEIKDGHGDTGRASMPPSLGASSRLEMRYNRQTQGRGQLAQLVSCLAVWLTYRRWPILRAAWIVCLTVCVYLSAFGTACLLFSLGQFGKAYLELVRPWRGKRDRVRPTDGAFH